MESAKTIVQIAVPYELGNDKMQEMKELLEARGYEETSWGCGSTDYTKETTEWEDDVKWARSIEGLSAAVFEDGERIE